MKNLYLFLGFIIILPMFGQDKNLGKVEDIAAYEMKSASKTIQLTVNPNTSNYDITYHKLEFTVNPTVSSISGKVTTNYVAMSNMTSITFDMFDALTATSVKVNGVSTTFSQPGSNELVINLPTMQLTGTTSTVVIEYNGNPTSSGFGSFTVGNHNGTPVLWTLSEPFGARDWWPCKQDLNDKIDSIDVYITAPSQYIAVSNGVEPDAQVIVGNNKITHFRHLYPIPAYLIAIA